MPHLVNYSAESQTGVCRTYIAKQARAPKTCANCSQPLHANATPGTWCTACAFPPCSGGCGQPRPQKASNHAKQKSDWYCQNCKGKCGNCGGTLPRNAEAGTWCATCAFPPCSGGCGEPRPRETRYHAQHKPQWLCRACSVSHGYQPCPICGLQRPQKSGYHVQVMPHWTCEACTVKSCPKCGEVLRPKAEDGALCLACAYPPCESCGRPRPRTHSEYHAQVMPTWTCAACRGNSLTGVPKKRRRRS